MPEAIMEAEAMSAYLKDRGIEAPHGSIYDEEPAQAHPTRRV
jgi:hypothetical protein